MARKASDLVLLLGSRGGGRGRGRSSGGLLAPVVGAFAWLLGGSSRSRRSNRGLSVLASKVPGWLVLGVAFACFGGGYLVGGKFGGGGGELGLRATLDGNGAGADRRGAEGAGPQKPGVIEDTKKLSNNAFFVAAYTNESDDVAREQASVLAGWLSGHGIDKARPYQAQTPRGLTWFVVVYYSGDSDQEATRNKLLALPDDVPDTNFQYFKKVETNWPPAYPIR